MNKQTRRTVLWATAIAAAAYCFGEVVGHGSTWHAVISAQELQREAMSLSRQ